MDHSSADIFPILDHLQHMVITMSSSACTNFLSSYSILYSPLRNHTRMSTESFILSEVYSVSYKDELVLMVEERIYIPP